MSIRKLTVAAMGLAALLVGSSNARADIIFDASPPFPPNPDQNVQFNDPALVLSGTTVQGSIDVPAIVFNITGLESLVANGGQARVSADDGGFAWLLFEPSVANIGFSAFEANLLTVAGAKSEVLDGTVIVTVTDTNGFVQSQSYGVSSSGNNFFNLLATDSQFIRSVLIQSDVDLDQIRQIRVGGVTDVGDNETTQVPEPATLMLVGAGLLAAVRRLR